MLGYILLYTTGYESGKCLNANARGLGRGANFKTRVLSAFYYSISVNSLFNQLPFLPAQWRGCFILQPAYSVIDAHPGCNLIKMDYN